jgi:hypothetical protein
MLVENGMSNIRRRPVRDGMWGVFQIVASVKKSRRDGFDVEDIVCL